MLPDAPGQRYLRTGDLGFVFEGDLYMTGRLKDLLIIRGRNHYPQDIEQTVEAVSPSLRAGCSAAFSIEVDQEEAVAVVAELVAGSSVESAAELGAAIVQAISEQHGLSLHALVLAPPGSVPKTSSGKLQRQSCRAAFLSGTLQPLWHWQALPPPPDVAPSAPAAPASLPQPPTTSSARPPSERAFVALAWLHARIAQLARGAGAALDLESPLSAYGLDSIKLVGLSGELADQLGQPLPPTFLFDHPTLASIATALRGSVQVNAATPEISDPAEPIAIIGMA